MSLRIRLARAGRRNLPFFRLVVAENHAPRDGRFIEKVGSYNPLLPKENEKRWILQEKRIKHWISMGALPTERVALALGKSSIIPMPEQPRRPKKAMPKKRAQERLKEKQAKAEALKAAASSDQAESQAST